MTDQELAVYYHDTLGWTDRKIGAFMGVYAGTISRWRHKARACPIAALRNRKKDNLLVGTMFCADCPGHIPAGCKGNCLPAKGRFEMCHVADECSCTKHDAAVIEAGRKWWKAKLAQADRIEAERERLERARIEYA